MIDTPVFLPISNELVAVIDPAPAFVTPETPPHVIGEAAPTVIVVAFGGESESRPTGALAVPVKVVPRLPLWLTYRAYCRCRLL